MKVDVDGDRIYIVPETEKDLETLPPVLDESLIFYTRDYVRSKSFKNNLALVITKK